VDETRVAAALLSYSQGKVSQQGGGNRWHEQSGISSTNWRIEQTKSILSEGVVVNASPLIR
jgi:hypothetical protein